MDASWVRVQRGQDQTDSRLYIRLILFIHQLIIIIMRHYFFYIGILCGLLGILPLVISYHFINELAVIVFLILSVIFLVIANILNKPQK